MSTNKILLRLYRQSKGLRTLTSLLAVYLLFILIYTQVFAGDIGYEVYVRGFTLGSFPLIIAMLFLSYEFIGKTRQSHLDEWFDTTDGGTLRLLWQQIGCLMLFPLLSCAVYFAATLVGNLFVLHLTSPAAIWNFACGIAFFFLLCPLTAILLSAAASLWLKRLSAYLCFALFAILNSPIKYTLEDRLSFRLSRDVPLSFVFCFYPQGDRSAPLEQEGLPLPETQVIAVCCWLLFALVLIALHFGIRHIHKRRLNLSVAAAAAAVLLALTGYNTLPYSNYNRDTTAGALQIIRDYIDDASLYTPPAESIPDFSITECVLSLDAGRYLRGKAELCVSPSNLTTYGFTLHHDYQVHTVTDRNGQALSFSRKGDFLTIETDHAQNGIVISYSGANNTFYTTRQSLFLPGYFPYYPMAGYHVFFTSDPSYQIIPCIQNTTTLFTVTLSNGGKVYANLPQTEPGVFQGTATAVSFIGGLLDSRQTGNMELVFPVCSLDYQSEQQTDSAVQTMLDLGLDSGKCRCILIMPNCNIRGIQRQNMLDMGDHLLTVDLRDAQNDYLKSKVLPYKVDLYESHYVYRTSPNTFESMASFAEDDSNAAYLLKIAIQEKGESAALSACETFLYNREDTRTIQAFFADFMREG